jgi:hypothetical protein
MLANTKVFHLTAKLPQSVSRFTAKDVSFHGGTVFRFTVKIVSFHGMASNLDGAESTLGLADAATRLSITEHGLSRNGN